MDSPVTLRPFHLAAVVVAVGSLALTGCATGSSPSSSSPGAASGRIVVVASTNVYGSIASQVGGSLVDVTSILSNPNQDPHGFEADAQTQLAISKAQVIVENGGGYDDYVDTMRASTSSKAAVVDAVKLSGFKATSGDFNEHVFYDYPTMVKVADAIAADLAQADPARSSSFFAGAATFKRSMQTLETQTSALAATFSGDRVAYTEPVPGYLFDAVGLKNVTPTAFSHAVETGNDVPPSALHDTLALMSGKKVRLLAYNEQASSPETSLVQAAAKQAGLPVLPVTETLPQGASYQTWQQGLIDAVAKALRR
jgi:zinc/manganese transport system substrate-binding protein